QALREGRISRRHAEVILNEAPAGLQDSADGGETVRAAYEQEVLPFAGVSTPARTRVHARAVVAMRCAVTQEEAHREAREERSVKITPTADGMAQLTAVIPEILAQGIFDRLTAMAKASEKDRTDEGDDRS